MEFLSDDNIYMLCEIHDNLKVSFEMMKNYATLYVNQVDTTQVKLDNLLELNKSFLLHLHIHYQSFRDTHQNSHTTQNSMEYVNEYAPQIPEPPSFLTSVKEEEGLTEGHLNLLIEQKMRERENELLTIQTQYKSADEPPESVKLIKISNDILTDLPLIEDTDDPYIIENEISPSQYTGKKRISIGDTTIFNYSDIEPPNKTIGIFELVKTNINILDRIHGDYVAKLNELNENVRQLKNQFKMSTVI